MPRKYGQNENILRRPWWEEKVSRPQSQTRSSNLLGIDGYIFFSNTQVPHVQRISGPSSVSPVLYERM